MNPEFLRYERSSKVRRGETLYILNYNNGTFLEQEVTVSNVSDGKVEVTYYDNLSINRSCKIDESDISINNNLEEHEFESLIDKNKAHNHIVLVIRKTDYDKNIKKVFKEVVISILENYLDELEHEIDSVAYTLHKIR